MEPWRPDPSTVFDPQRCSFSEMSFCENKNEDKLRIVKVNIWNIWNKVSWDLKKIYVSNIQFQFNSFQF